MKCAFQKLIYPPNTVALDPSSYMVAVYKLIDRLPDSDGNIMSEVKVVGFNLPIVKDMDFDITGNWNKNAKHGIQFEMEDCQEIITPSRQGIISYLSSGYIKGIGPKTAEKIYDKFGNSVLEILDNNPEWLKEIPGISDTKLERICDSYMASRGARNVISFLTPHGVSANRAVKIYKEFGRKTIQLISQNPYVLCDMHGIGFITADNIAQSIGVDPLSPERIRAGLRYTLKEAELKGHLCMNKDEFALQCIKLLNTEDLTAEFVAEQAYTLLKCGKLVLYNGYVYLDTTAKAEQAVAERIRELVSKKKIHYNLNLDAEIDREERRLGLTLVAEQRQAVKDCLTSHICIISGGPGTGKTLIQSVFLNIYKRAHPDAKIICCAPTGRAARRIEQCTGYHASTLHKALGLLADEDEHFNEPTKLDAEFVLVDEVSMMDIFLAKNLLEALPDDVQLILVGDADQLPSVGPGAVLSELIACGQLPVTKLDRVFRQNVGSKIALNAKLIRHSNTALETGEDFVMRHSPDCGSSAAIIEEVYLSEVARVGIDNVALLTPQRHKTETCVNALNSRLREKINPPDTAKPELNHGRQLFRLGDKVMQLKNWRDVNNGDVGYVKSIVKDSNFSGLYVDFGDNRIVEYDVSDLDMLELAYACTIHKSQGSEYSSVIINMQFSHYIMLKRPLIYTAITRAKKKVTIVGERKALCIAIQTADTEGRATMLAIRINELCGAN